MLVESFIKKGECMDTVTVREFMEELLKKAKSSNDNMWFESKDGDYVIAICDKSKVVELIELAVSLMDGVEKEIFEHMLSSSISALEQVKQKQKDGEQL
jgi:DNA-binding protein YbaB